LSRSEKERLFRRGLLTDAAAALFREAPYQTVKVEEITDKAGFSKGSFYKYFYNKDELVFAILYNETERLNEKLAVLGGKPQSEKLLPDLCRLVLKFHLETVHLLFTADHLIKSAEKSEDFIASRLVLSWQEKITESTAKKNLLLAKVINACMESGEICAPAGKTAAALFDSAARGLCLDHLPAAKPNQNSEKLLLSLWGALPRTKT
jgi:AcrR family transcriptional regulator